MTSLSIFFSSRFLPRLTNRDSIIHGPNIPKFDFKMNQIINVYLQNFEPNVAFALIGDIERL